jgi:hypothetical protein
MQSCIRDKQNNSFNQKDRDYNNPPYLCHKVSHEFIITNRVFDIKAVQSSSVVEITWRSNNDS